MDERKLKILAAVVDEYILTGEPVGSKAISKVPGINVSAATIRNDMAMLEQLGYLEQPHTSAGRIPTFSGYRLYIDKLMTVEELSDSERKKLDDMLGEEDNLTEESIIQSAGKALAELTKCAAVVANSAPKFSVITKVDVIPTGKRLYLILLITSNGSIKNKACRLEFDLDDEQLSFFSHYIQENLQGVSIEELSEERMEKLITALGAYMITLAPLVKGLCELSQDLLHNELTISGEKNLISCNEFDKNEIVRFIEHKNEFADFLNDSFSGIQVMFSKEKNDFIIGNSSMIVSKYRKGDKEAGSLGIVGPMRLNYSKIIPYIEYFTQKITEVLSEEDDDFAGKDT
ncbi:MAG: heat-inducible transcription repressor HrcA [Ruminococcus sp.]|jgi:heat-inducible transcriptional repressor|nr:heat-inducible transcription repressor HrcA [Ruminococcus sp.]